MIYTLSPSADTTANLTMGVLSFNNPISTAAKSGFSVTI